jgi:Alkylmercury lyase
MDNPNASASRDPQCDLPEIEVSDQHRQVQAAAFALLLDTGRPSGHGQIAACAGLTETEVKVLLEDFDTVGRVRFDLDNNVVGIAGLSIEPTRHRLDFAGTSRWTWCALDAIGILGALKRDATYTSQTPDSDEQLEIRFDSDGPADTEAVVFMADGYGSDSVVETWCPTVNLFRDSETANKWAANNGITGRPIPVPDLVEDAAAMWAPVTRMATKTRP